MGGVLRRMKFLCCCCRRSPCQRSQDRRVEIIYKQIRPRMDDGFSEIALI